MELTSDGKKIIVGDKRNDVILEKNQSIVKPILFLDGEEIIVRLEIRRYPVSLQETYMFVVSVYVCSEITGAPEACMFFIPDRTKLEIRSIS